MKKYILFDNDGVLVETEYWYYQANYEILKTLNIHLSLKDYQKIMISGGTAWKLALNQGYSLQEVEKFKAQRDELYQHYLKTKDISIVGITETLEELSKKYKMAIVTTSTRLHFEIIHKNKEITKYMDFILCLEDYERAKPYPDPYLKALKKFNASSKEAIVVEDSQRGLDSAYNANIDCIIVKNEFTKSHNFNKAKYFIHKFENLKRLL